MSAGYVKIMVMAAVADKEIRHQEMVMLNTYRQLYPPIKTMPEEEIDRQKGHYYNEKQAGYT